MVRGTRVAHVEELANKKIINVKLLKKLFDNISVKNEVEACFPGDVWRGAGGGEVPLTAHVSGGSPLRWPMAHSTRDAQTDGVNIPVLSDLWAKGAATNPAITSGAFSGPKALFDLPHVIRALWPAFDVLSKTHQPFILLRRHAVGRYSQTVACVEIEWR